MVETVSRTDDIAAAGVSIEDYLARYAAGFFEWVKGDVIKMAPISARHDDLAGYLRELFRAYFALNPIGRVKSAPFVMRVDAVEIAREPDLQIILDRNPGDLTDTAMMGPADICVEIVSPESVGRDHGTKLEEYEKAGVGEYWIIDPIRKECRFYQLQASGIYAVVHPDTEGHYGTPKLPRLALHVPTLWQDELPDIFAVAQAVRAMIQQ